MFYMKLLLWDCRAGSEALICEAVAAAVDICAPPARDKVEPLKGPAPVIPDVEVELEFAAAAFEVAAAFEA